MPQPVLLTNVRRARAAAFTLIELVIAIGILALIMTVAYSSLGQIMRSTKILNDQRDASFIANAVLIRMSRELQLALAQQGRGLLPPCDKVSAQTPLKPSVLVGDKVTLQNGRRGDQITFVAAEGGQYLPDGGSHSGSVQITYRVDRDTAGAADGFLFLRDELPDIRPPNRACEKLMSFSLSNRLTTLQFEYFDDQDNRWVDEWGQPNTPRATRLPQLIRFTVGIISPLGKEDVFSTTVPLPR